MKWRTLRLALPLLMLLSVLGSFAVVMPASADDGVNIAAPKSGTLHPTIATNRDGSKACAIFATYASDPAQVYIRVLDTASQTWNPPLGSDPVQLKDTSDPKAQHPHCAFDGAGNLYTAWNQGAGTQSIVVRRLPAGADPGNIANWSPVVTAEGDGDFSDVDALKGDPSSAQAWLSYRKYNGGPFDVHLRSVTPAGVSPPQVIADGTLVNEVRVAVDDAGWVNITYVHEGQHGVKYVYRRPDTGVLSSPVDVPGSYGTARQAIAVNRATGRVHFAFGTNFTELHYLNIPGRGNSTFNDHGVIAYVYEKLWQSVRIAASASGRTTIIGEDDKVSLRYLVSDNDGDTWQDKGTLTAPAGGLEEPWVAEDPSGNAYVLYSRHSPDAAYYIFLPKPGPPVINNVNLALDSPFYGHVTWTTNVLSNSRVYFGTSPTVDVNCQTANCSSRDGNATTNHLLFMRTLQPSTTYFYRVSSVNAYGTAYFPPLNQPALTFTTPAFGVAAGNLVYYPLSTPVRLVDTRAGAAFPACAKPATQPGGTTRTQVAAVPNTQCSALAQAYVLTGNVTAVNPQGSGWITLFPTGQPLPSTSNVNYTAGQIIPNAFTVGLGGGQFNIYTQATTDIIVDITGYYAPPATGGLYFHPLPNPVRLIDTRGDSFTACQAQAPLTGGQRRDVKARSQSAPCDTIPSSAVALAGNATVYGPLTDGYLTLFPANLASPPTTSNVNYVAGQTIPNSFIVGLGPAGWFSLYSSASTHVIIDITGYYDTNPGLKFNSLSTPLRILETRPKLPACDDANAPLQGNAVRSEQIRGICGVPGAAQVLVGNATAVPIVPGQAGGYITLWPSGETQPNVSNLNYSPNQIIANAFMARIGANGAINIYAQTSTHFILDYTGYFAP